MFCAQCGKQLPDDARFCTSCGAKTQPIGANESDRANAEPDSVVSQDVVSDAKPEINDAPVEEPAEAQAPMAEAAPLKQAIESTKRRSRPRVPIVVLIALALALAAGTAYAAYRVCVDIIIPAIQPPTIEVPQAEDAEANGAQGDTDGAGETTPDAEEEPEIVQATGNPQSILQIAEILAMDPADIPDFLESQGMEAQDALGTGYYTYAWMAIDENPYAEVDPEGRLVGGSNPQTGAPYAQLDVGANIPPLYYYGFDTPESYDAAKLESGSAPNSIKIAAVPFRFFGEDDADLASFDPANTSDETINEFLALCGLGEKMGDYTYSFELADSDDTYTLRACTGIVEVDGQKMLWYLTMSKGTLGSELGCLPLDEAWGSFDRNVSLYTQEQWDAASDEEKAQMAATCIVQDHTTGNGGMRVNLLDGTRQIWEEDSDAPGGYAWHDCEIGIDPETGEESYISTVTGNTFGPV